MPQQIISRIAEPAERFAIPLDEAWYCESCRVVLNDSRCFCCASDGHTQRLALWLDREYQPISIPLRGVFLTVTPDRKKSVKQATCPREPQQLRRAG